MGCTKELTPWALELTITSTEEMQIWERQWYPVPGVSLADLTADVRNRVLGSGAAMSIKPAIQYAVVRTDRPDAGAAIAAGSVITAEGLTHFEETISGASKAYFRRGWVYKLTAGSFARCEVVLHTAFRSCGRMFTPKELQIEPHNATAVYHFVSLSGVMAAVGLDTAKIIAILNDNMNNALEWRLCGRAFNDPMARGSWTLLEAAWRATTAGDSVDNTGEVTISSALSLSSYHFCEVGIVWRKSTDGAANSRCLMQLILALTYA